MKAILLGLLALACSASSFDGRVYHSGDVAFQLRQVPSDWRRLDVDDSTLAFRDDAGSATIAINARCGKDANDVPLRALTEHLFLQFTERALVSQSTIELDGREALKSELDAKLDGVRKHFCAVVLKKNSCVYDFLYIAKDTPTPARLAEFDAFVGGFATIE
jgi:hypothetical protein